MKKYFPWLLLGLSAFVWLQEASAMTAAESKKFCLDTVLVNHGYWSRAQFQCDIPNYSQEVMAKVKSCLNIISESKADEVLMKGMKKFDALEKAVGHRDACDFMQFQYPGAYLLK